MGNPEGSHAFKDPLSSLKLLEDALALASITVQAASQGVWRLPTRLGGLLLLQRGNCRRSHDDIIQLPVSRITSDSSLDLGDQGL
jgi:hypothetical protein